MIIKRTYTGTDGINETKAVAILLSSSSSSSVFLDAGKTSDSRVNSKEGLL
jgi:hypothetical protein